MVQESQQDISFVVRGSPQSKSNSRRLVVNSRTKRPMFIKSQSALSYADAFNLQCPKLRHLLEGDLFFAANIYYASRRNDLDESLILDLCQGRVLLNDRQVKEKWVRWGLDPDNPRTEITITPLLGAGVDLHRSRFALVP
jgi:Holliday junction resolvase RusA-like endonuclease